MSRVLRLLFLYLPCSAGVLLGASLAFAEAAPYERCRESPIEIRGGTATLAISAVDRSGAVTRSRAQLFWQQDDDASRVLLEMLEPEEIAGSRLLLVETPGDRPEAWAYLPEIAAVKRVGSRHLRRPLFGTDITYADLERARGLAEDAQIDAWTEGEFQDRAAWRIEAHAGRERVVTWLDQERCAPLRIEMNDRKDRLARLLEISLEGAASEEGTFVPRELLVRDVAGESETRVVVEEFSRGEVAARFFDPERLAPITTHAAALLR